MLSPGSSHHLESHHYHTRCRPEGSRTETFTLLGQGDLRTVDLLKALAANGYGHCLAIEYEEKPESPLEDIKACLAEARKAIAAIGPA